MATADLLIRGGRVADPVAGTLEAADVWIREGRIEHVGEVPESVDVPVVEASGRVVSPGFVDLHVHFREPGQEWKEDIASGSACAAAGGFTTVCVMPNTKPALHDRETVRYVVERGREVGLTDVRVIGAVTRDIAGSDLAEIGAMVEAGCVGFSDDGRPILDSGVMRRALEYVSQFGVPVIQHAEDCGLTRGGAMNEGAHATRMGLGGMPSCAEDIVVSRDLALLEIVDSHLHVAHASTAGTMEMVRRAKARASRVTCEVTPHHLLLSHDDVAANGYDANFKMNPPLRSPADVVALIRACVDGTVDAVATDHAPHRPDEKENGFAEAPFGVIGLETALGVTLTALVEPGHMDLVSALRLLTSGPCEAFGFSDRGRLIPGARGDVTIFDPDASYVVDSAQSLSRSRNTPFEGRRLLGVVHATVLEGRVVFERSE